MEARAFDGAHRRVESVRESVKKSADESEIFRIFGYEKRIKSAGDGENGCRQKPEKRRKRYCMMQKGKKLRICEN